MGIPKAKEIINHSLGEVGLLINLDTDSVLDLSTGKLDFDDPPDGWAFYGLTSQDTKMATDVQVYESKVGIPEFTIKRFLIGVEGTVSGSFLEADVELHDLIAGNGNIKNIGGLTSSVAVVAVSESAKTIDVVNADATNLKVGNTIIVDSTANLASSMNSAKLTSKTVGATNTTLKFSDGWFRTLPTTSMHLQSYKYSIAQLAASNLDYLQAMLVYETCEGVQFVYHFPKITFTPNISPEFPTTSSVFKLPFEFKLIGVANSQHFDGNRKVLGYYYELLQRTAVS